MWLKDIKLWITRWQVVLMELLNKKVIDTRVVNADFNNTVCNMFREPKVITNKNGKRFKVTIELQEEIMWGRHWIQERWGAFTKWL